MTAADESRVVWRHEDRRQDDDLRRAAETLANRAAGACTEPHLFHAEAWRQRAVSEAVAAVRAALPARSEPRAEGLRDVQERIFVAWLLDNGLKGDRYGAALQRLQLFRADALGNAATPPAEGLDVERPGILDESIEGNVQRVDALRVLELALASQGVPDVNAPSLLRDIEEGGYTLRLTTRDERRRRNERGFSS